MMYKFMIFCIETLKRDPSGIARSIFSLVLRDYTRLCPSVDLSFGQSVGVSRFTFLVFSRGLATL